jgi:hypothetical protein
LVFAQSGSTPLANSRVYIEHFSESSKPFRLVRLLQACVGQIVAQSAATGKSIHQPGNSRLASLHREAGHQPRLAVKHLGRCDICGIGLTPGMNCPRCLNLIP